MQSPKHDSDKNLIRQKLIASLLVGMFALVMLGLGLMAIFSGHFEGVTKTYKPISLDGYTAQWMGGVQICLGMMTLTVAMPNKSVAIKWGVFWAVLFIVCLIAAIHYK